MLPVVLLKSFLVMEHGNNDTIDQENFAFKIFSWSRPTAKILLAWR